MGAYVNRNGKEYYKADDGKLYSDYASAAKSASTRQAATREHGSGLISSRNAERKTDSNPFNNFNLGEAALGLVFNNPTAKAIRTGARMAGEALGIGTAVDAGENAIRAVTGDRRRVDPKSYSGASRTALADATDNAYARGATPDKSGYIPVGYSDYKPGAEKYVTGAMWSRKNSDGSYEMRPGERYDFNASAAEDREGYKANLDKATQAAWDRKDLGALVANLPDHINYHTGIGGRGMEIGGKFSRPEASIPERPTNAPAPGAPPVIPTANAPAPQPAVDNRESSYSVKSGDTLSAIARSKGTTVDALAKLNGIKDVNRIGVGQQLRF